MNKYLLVILYDVQTKYIFYKIMCDNCTQQSLLQIKKEKGLT